MKKITVIFLLFIIAFHAKAQTNLVPNPSFDIYDTCPFTMGQINYAIPWFQPLTIGSTTDYYDTCSNYANIFSIQQPHSGSGMAGIILYDGGGWREYIEVKLYNSLIPNRNYCVEFYVNLLNSSFAAIDAIGLCFSVDSLLNDAHTSDSMRIQRFPQIENIPGNIISDTVNWVKISGNFIADSNYQFLTIGNFLPNSQVNFITMSGGVSSYYFIDDVLVYECDDTIVPPKENALSIPNAFTPNSDGVNDIFKVHGVNIKTLHGTIINRWGQELFKWDDANGGWDGKHDGMDVSAGVYFYIISVTFDDGEVQEKHGSLELVR